MAQALIKINGVDGSNADLPIGVLVQLDNHNTGGEVAFQWTILDQPAGPADTLSNAVIQNPTLTPMKEGSYLLSLQVNGGGPGLENTAIAGILQLKTRLRVPASGETSEVDTNKGWGTVGAADGFQILADSTRADPGIIVGIAGAPGLNRGHIVRMSNTVTIKTGLPGQENVPQWVNASATLLSSAKGILGIVENGVDGSTTPANGALINVRVFGQFLDVTGFGVPGTQLFLANGGGLATVPGNQRRLLAQVMTQAVAYQFDGMLTDFASAPSPVVTFTAGTGGGTSVLDLVYISGADFVGKANATAVATMPAVGFVVSKPNAGTAIVQLLGTLTGFGGLTAGHTYYADLAVAGGITDDVSAYGIGNIVQSVGIALDATTMLINIDPSFSVV